MLRKSIIAGAAAILVGIGSLAATTTPASAGSYGGGYVGGNGWYFGWGQWPRYKPYHPPRRPVYKPARRKVCVPKYKTVRAWKPRYGWVSYRVYAGRVCKWRPVYKKW
ncbi:MAG: hypothetical protein GY798_08015 [Hyphomicrobiales bacterium]|nr:hypothetical protein [Hyphomicrobiales bacterium]